jgi:hypothetical protein
MLLHRRCDIGLFSSFSQLRWSLAGLYRIGRLAARLHRKGSSNRGARCEYPSRQCATACALRAWVTSVFDSRCYTGETHPAGNWGREYVNCSATVSVAWKRRLSLKSTFVDSPSCSRGAGSSNQRRFCVTAALPAHAAPTNAVRSGFSR